MRVWLFKDGESLPVEENSRRMRTGMLAEELRRRGHDVHWFSSTFLHLPKRLFSDRDCDIEVQSGLTLHLFNAGRFRHNLSYGRYRFYRRYASRVREFCARQAPPDCIVCTFPLIDVAANVVSFAKEHGVPVILDVRDLWPDTIVDMFPSWSRRVARLALRRDFAKTRFAMRQATCLCAMSAGVMQWGLGYADRTVGPWDRIIPIGYPAPSASADKDESAELCEVLTKMKNRQMYAYVGTFGHTYNLAAIVRTARRLLTAGRDDLGFMLAGNGPQYKEVQRLVDGLPNVLLTGWLGAREIRTILSRARAGLLPWNTINDAMPNKFFEYISEGLPVISSAEGELNDLIEREGIGRTYRKGNEVELSQALLELNDNEDFANRCAERSKALFERKFREDAVYGAYAAYVEEIAAGKRN